MSKFKVSAPDFSKVQSILSLAKSIQAAIDDQKNCDELLAQMSMITECGHYDKDYFSNLYKHSNLDDFAALAAYPPAKKVLNISRDDLIEIMQLAKDNIIEPSLDYYLALFDANVAMPGASNLLFHLPDDWPYSRDDPSTEEIVDYVLSQEITLL